MKKTALFTFLILFLISSFNYAQEQTQTNPFWLNIGFGGSPEYFNVNASYNKRLEKYSYQISVNGSLRDFLSSRGMTTGNFGFGLTNVSNELIGSLYIGPSVSYGEAKSNTYFWGVGLALNAQVYFMPLYKLFPGVGLGFEAFYNYNTIQTKDVDYRHVYSFRISVCLTDLHMN